MVIAEDCYMSVVIAEDSYMSVVIAEDSYMSVVIAEDSYMSEVIAEDSYMSEVIAEDSYMSEVILSHSVDISAMYHRAITELSVRYQVMRCCVSTCGGWRLSRCCGRIHYVTSLVLFHFSVTITLHSWTTPPLH